MASSAQLKDTSGLIIGACRYGNERNWNGWIADVAFSDPHVATLVEGNMTMTSVDPTPEALRGFDCLVIATAHTGFDYEQIIAAGIPIVDSRNALKGIKADHILKI